MKKTPLKRGNKGLKKSVALKRGTGIKKAGKKTLEWSKVREELKKEINITRCELDYPGCENLYLGYAHCVKRRHLKPDAEVGSPEHIKTVIMACQKCHDFLESLPESDMSAVVMNTIAKRIS